MNHSTLHALAAAGAALVVGLIAVPATASPVLDDERTYLSLTAGLGVRDRPLSNQINLAAGPVPVVVNGITEVDRAQSLSLTLGRQSREKQQPDDPDARRWRLEAQWWMASVSRNRFRAGRLEVPLSDELESQGLFGHALGRVWRGDESQWWIGAGLGYARVSVPDASAASPSCGCLAAVSGRGTAWRLMSTLERTVTDSMTINGTLMYTGLPDARTQSTGLPSIETKIPGIMEFNIGLRFTF